MNRQTMFADTPADIPGVDPVHAHALHCAALFLAGQGEHRSSADVVATAKTFENYLRGGR